MAQVKSMLFILLALIPILLYSQEIDYAEDIDAYVYNDVLRDFSKTYFNIKYDLDKDIYLFFIKDYSCLLYFEGGLLFIETLKMAIDKYKDWNIKASKKGVVLDKEILEFLLLDKCAFIRGDDAYLVKGLPNIKYHFFSQNKEKHQFVIKFEKLKSSKNEYITCDLDDVYFWYKDIMKLRGIFEKEYHDKKIKEYEKKKAVENEFN